LFNNKCKIPLSESYTCNKIFIIVQCCIYDSSFNNAINDCYNEPFLFVTNGLQYAKQTVKYLQFKITLYKNLLNCNESQVGNYVYLIFFHNLDRNILKKRQTQINYPIFKKYIAYILTTKRTPTFPLSNFQVYKFW
jgi:hypothetical protein